MTKSKELSGEDDIPRKWTEQRQRVPQTPGTFAEQGPEILEVPRTFMEE